MLSSGRWRQSLAIVVVGMVAFRLAHARLGAWVIDDAGITYAAAVELADHHTVADYPEGTPVESYSNPLVYFTVAALRVVGVFDPVTTHVWIEALLFGVALALCHAVLRTRAGPAAAVAGTAAFAALELITPSTWLWYASGLENLWVSTGVVAMVWLWNRRARGARPAAWTGVVAALAALTRPDAPVYVAAYYAALVAFACPADERYVTHLRRVMKPALVTAALFAAFLAWRWHAYGDVLPNTYYAKVWGPPPLLYNLRTVAIGEMMPYYDAGILAASALAVGVFSGNRWLAAALVVMTAASLALPITAGEDFFMGERRYGTTFFAMSHLSFAVLVALLAGWRAHKAGARAAHAVLALLVVSLAIQRARGPAAYADVTSIPHVAGFEGGARWEQAMRLGVPNAVYSLSDAGGSSFVGGGQLVDNAYLADFDLAHQGRYFGAPALLRQFDQYVYEERRPDLLSDSTAIGVVDPRYVDARYVRGAPLLVRRDLVEVAQVDASMHLIYADARLAVYLSDDTVQTVAPRGLLRCELVVAWAGTAPDDVRIRGAIAGGEPDQIYATPHRPGWLGIERVGLLLNGPPIATRAPLELEIERGDDRVFAGVVASVDVTDDAAALAAAADAIVGDRSVDRAMRRLAWLREQSIPRLGSGRFHVIMHALANAAASSDRSGGRDVLLLRHDARPAHFVGVADELAVRELVVAGRELATCDGASGARRIECQGRAIDDMRRMGYFDVLARAPDVAAQLGVARAELDRRWPAGPDRYLALVGLTFAFPGDIWLRRALIATRKSLTEYPDIAPADR